MSVPESFAFQRQSVSFAPRVTFWCFETGDAADRLKVGFQGRQMQMLLFGLSTLAALKKLLVMLGGISHSLSRREHGSFAVIAGACAAVKTKGGQRLMLLCNDFHGCRRLTGLLSVHCYHALMGPNCLPCIVKLTECERALSVDGVSVHEAVMPLLATCLPDSSLGLKHCVVSVFAPSDFLRNES